MIFVATGTFRPFPRLLEEVDHLVEKQAIREKVIVQAGEAHYHSERLEIFDFVGDEQFRKYIREADVIITHAGSGALFNAIRLHKKVIAFARLKRYGEHIDDHQLELARKLSEEGYIIDGTHDLPAAWEKLKDFVPREYDFSSAIVSSLQKYLDSLINQ